MAPECAVEFDDPADAFVMRHMVMALVLPAMCLAIVIANWMYRFVSACLRRRARRLNVVNPMIAMWQISFINSAKLVFKSFDCTSSKTAGHYLDALPVVQCNLSDPRYFQIAATGAYTLVIYCVLVPVILYAYLYATDKNDAQVQSHVGWIYLRYHPRRWYYECILFIQKVAVAASTVFMTSEKLLLKSLVVVGGITAVSFSVHSFLKPYPAFFDDPRLFGQPVSDNLLEYLGMVTQVNANHFACRILAPSKGD